MIYYIFTERQYRSPPVITDEPNPVEEGEFENFI